MRRQIIPDKPVLQVKALHCSDIDDMAELTLNPPTSFSMPFQFSIGEEGSDAADIFEIVVCSMDRIETTRRHGGPFIALPLLIPSVVAEFVARLVVYANMQDDPLACLVTHLAWEFDGYR